MQTTSSPSFALSVVCNAKENHRKKWSCEILGARSASRPQDVLTQPFFLCGLHSRQTQRTKLHPGFHETIFSSWFCSRHTRRTKRKRDYSQSNADEAPLANIKMESQRWPEKLVSEKFETQYVAMVTKLLSSYLLRTSKFHNNSTLKVLSLRSLWSLASGQQFKLSAVLDNLNKLFADTHQTLTLLT